MPRVPSQIATIIARCLRVATYSDMPTSCHSEPAGEESRSPRTDATRGRDSSSVGMTQDAHTALTVRCFASQFGTTRRLGAALGGV